MNFREKCIEEYKKSEEKKKKKKKEDFKKETNIRMENAKKYGPEKFKQLFGFDLPPEYIHFEKINNSNYCIIANIDDIKINIHASPSQYSGGGNIEFYYVYKCETCDNWIFSNYITSKRTLGFYLTEGVTNKQKCSECNRKDWNIKHNEERRKRDKDKLYTFAKSLGNILEIAGFNMRYHEDDDYYDPEY